MTFSFRRRILSVLLLALLAQPATVARAAAPPAADGKRPRTVAVVSTDAGASSATADALIGRLGTDPSLALVERAALDRLAAEQIVAKLAPNADAQARSRAGRLVGADVLVLLNQADSPAGPAVRLLVCDAATGARLAQHVIPAKGDTTDALAREVRAAVARFPAGVVSVVAVPDLVSRDLRHDHDHLQRTLADLLRDGLSTRPGVAVLEVEEAKSIALEAERTGGQVRRVVPVYAEGEYRTDPLAEGGPRVTVTFQLRTAQRDLAEVESGPIPLDAAGRFVAETVGHRLLDALDQPAGEPFSPQREFDRLVVRAARFAEIGEFDRSAALREAALALRPDADEQRIRLVREYARHNLSPVEVWPTGHRATLDDPFWAGVVARSRETWRRSLGHVEYLVRNRRVDLQTGTGLFSEAVQSINGIRATTSEALGEEEKVKKEFVRHVAPALMKLDAGKGHTVEYFVSAAYRVYENTFYRVDGNFLTPEDLTLAGDLLCDLLPADTPVAAYMLYRLSDGTRMFGGGERDVSRAEWHKFVARLAASPRPLVSAYGRYGQLCERRYRGNETSEAVLAEAQSLLAALRREDLRRLDPGNFFGQAVSDEVVRIESALRPKPRPAPVAVAPEQPKERPVEQADGSLRCERVLLTPVSVTVEGPGKQPHGIDGHRWRGSGGFAGWVGLVPAWKGTDAIHSHGAVLLVRPEGKAREILVNPKLSIHSVVFDGRYLWASGGYDNGVYAFTADGKVAAHVTAEQGLPGAYVEMPLHALSEGRVMAAGSIGQQGRGWLATIDLTGPKPEVNVFHEAVKTWDYAAEDRRLEQTMEPAMRFRPEWIVGHTDAAGKRWAFVGRDWIRVPLAVEVETLKVTTYPIRKLFDEESFPRSERPAAAFLSRGGLFYVAGAVGNFKVFRLDEQTRRFRESPKRDSRDWHMGNATGGCLMEHEGYLYYAGESRWLRHHLQSGRDEVLVGSPRSLPNYGSGGAWRLAVSNAFGPVAWHEGKLYRMSVLDPK